MEEKDFTILRYIAEEMHLTKAAERLYMTQPALTYRIQQLEKELDTQILIKNGKRIKFTSQGEYLVSFANKMLAEYRVAKDSLANMSSDVQGTLRIGAASTFAKYFLPSLMKSFVTQYPKVIYNVYTGPTPKIMDLLETESVDLVFIRGEYKWSEQKFPIMEENLCLISKHEIDLEELPNQQRIEYRYNINQPTLGKHKPQTSIRDSLRSWWSERYSVPPQTTVIVDSYDICKEMVINDLGYAFIPEPFINKGDDLHKINLLRKNGEAIKRSTWLHYKEASEQLNIVKKFVSFVRSQSFHSTS
ncbi:DNA-binding transcriptional LysR family regulator [Cytobacillus firmus]|uniref:DNA-binding transcriptional LysR family regulator n=2 Tax=Cytobacillus TaxID=2675230 RepID=A0A366JB56_CYTFI|nr:MULTISPECIES: LysR family transcriptional regulator [Cytobacillus]RBP84097.1 DNA-binding transcriptional LysR family regulator [Cytobacillus firmus]TDX34556.1 DNA-binding transcriptional LysR family regulator [Cytobacillus oceanisediminis]